MKTPITSDMKNRGADALREAMRKVNAGRSYQYVATQVYEAMCAAAPPAEQPRSEQGARFLIEGTIANGFQGVHPPADPWLMDYWKIGRKLAAYEDMLTYQAEPTPTSWVFDMTPAPEFIEYVRRNYSGEVVFSDPEWHARRLWSAALKLAKPEKVRTAQQPAQPQPTTEVTTEVKTWPARIWLQHGDGPEVPSYHDCHDVSWCADQIDESDVEYVRADLAAPPAEPLRSLENKLQAALDELHEILKVRAG